MIKLFKFPFILILLFLLTSCTKQRTILIHSSPIQKNNKTLSLVEKRLLKKSNRLISEGILLWEKGKNSLALSYIENSLKIRREILGERHNLTAKSYTSLGAIYYSIGQYRQALIYHKKALKVNKLDITVLGNIASAYSGLGNHKKALYYLHKALKTIKSSQDINLVSLYNNLGSCYQSNGEYEQSLIYYKKSIQIKKIFLNPLDAKFIISYINISSLYQEIGNYKEAMNYLSKAIQIAETLKKYRLSTLYNNFGDLLRVKGKYHLSLKYLNKALLIEKSKKLKNNRNIAYILSNIAITYGMMMNFNKAKQYLQEAINTFPKNLPKETIFLPTVYNNLGDIEEKLNNNSNAIIYYQKAIFLAKKNFNLNHPFLATLYTNLGKTYIKKSNFNKASELLKKALKIYLITFDKNHPNLATIYSVFAGLEEKKSNFIKAIKYNNKALKIYKASLNKSHPFISNIYNTNSRLYFHTKDYKNAYITSQNSFNIYQINRNINFSYLSEKSKVNENQVNSFQINFLLDFSYKYSQNPYSYNVKNILFDDILNFKGLAFENQNILTSIESKATLKTKQKIAKLRTLTRKLAESQKKLKQIDTTQLEHDIENIQIKLSEKNIRFKELLGLRNINHKTISSLLSNTQLYIDFIKTNKHYYVFTLDKNNKVEFKQISKKSTIILNQNIKSYQINNKKMVEAIANKTLTTQLEKENQIILSNLYNNLITPYLSKQLKNKTSIIISPDGLLNFLPFEALYHNGKYLIEDYDISYISSGREFVRQTKRQKANPKYEMICFGNPDFNSSLPIAETKFMSDKQVTLDTWEQYKHFRPIGDGEIKTIRKYYPNALIYEKKNATTSNLMRVESSKILHFSTHGKFLTNSTIKNPMLKAGLALAGANKPNSDGIVTALKLSALDLKDTELVVLSACESGLGDIQNSEGVMGLPKAFLQAGAREVIMSLWSVSTLGTAELMEHFYENVHSGQSYATALRNAKIKMIEEKQHPYYWSAFILHGI